MKAEEKSSKGAINYGDFAYWDQRYAKKKGERFEWLDPILVPSIPRLPFVASVLLGLCDLVPIDAIAPKHWPSVV